MSVWGQQITTCCESAYGKMSGSASVVLEPGVAQHVLGEDLAPVAALFGVGEDQVKFLGHLGGGVELARCAGLLREHLHGQVGEVAQLAVQRDCPVHEIRRVAGGLHAARPASMRPPRHDQHAGGDGCARRDAADHRRDEQLG